MEGVLNLFLYEVGSVGFSLCLALSASDKGALQRVGWVYGRLPGANNAYIIIRYRKGQNLSLQILTLPSFAPYGYDVGLGNH